MVITNKAPSNKMHMYVYSPIILKILIFLHASLFLLLVSAFLFL